MDRIHSLSILVSIRNIGFIVFNENFGEINFCVKANLLN